ncbi:SAF domain-containing protein [Actinomadura sp. GTD37]|uniref:SAF domain-containing protein n=1 Tax=Actinomadura sp. GTD37 TaxID=1778030 RepID=UPI0035C02296
MTARLARLRRPLAALFAAAAAGLVLLALRPGPPPSVRVLAAARDLPAGKRLAPSDLQRVALPPSAVPAGALREGAGRVLAGPMRRGESLTDARVIGDALLQGYGPDTVAAPVRITDPAAVRLLRPGDRIDVLSAPTDEARPFPPAEGAGTPSSQRPPAAVPSDIRPAPPGAAPSENVHQAAEHRAARGNPSADPAAPRNALTARLTAQGAPNWTTARVVVSDVPVVAVPPPDENGEQQGALLVLATDRAQALALAAAGPLLSLTITGH